MPDALLSIITPSYNQCEFIEKNILSVMQQSGSVDFSIEHIIVDGGSTDRTVDILKRYSDQYNLQWVSESDRGQSHAVNKGINMATGTWIGWQNSDDYYLPGSFAAAFSNQRLIQDVDVIYGDTLVVDANGAEIARIFRTRPSQFIQRYWTLFASNQSTFIRKSIIEELGGLDEELIYTMDAKLMWQLLEGNYQYRRISTALGALRKHDEAKTAGDVGYAQKQELNPVYGQTWYEPFVPDKLLGLAAKSLKAGYLLAEGRYNAIQYNIDNIS
jgi:GT2 family glycosyltransferase